MNQDEIKNIESNLEIIAGVIENILNENRSKIVESAEAIANVLASLPKEVKETKLFKMVIKFENLEIKYEEILDFLEDCSITCSNDAWNMFLENNEDDSKLYLYLKKIINNKDIAKREKVIILLAHIEEVILDALSHSRQPNERVKKVVKDIAIINNFGF